MDEQLAQRKAALFSDLQELSVSDLELLMAMMLENEVLRPILMEVINDE